MPELPEVETTRRGIEPHLLGQRIDALVVRQPQLRWPIPAAAIALKHATVTAVRRRAKFLLIDTDKGQLLLHLGMSGSLRVLPSGTPVGKHDHADLVLSGGQLLRFNDPRRFGAVLFSEQPDNHPLLARLGPEPLSDALTGAWLHQRGKGRKQAIKTFIMDNHTVVGVGNIYAQESLFLAGIHPSRPAGRISAERYDTLASVIKEVLRRAIKAGGTTLKDFTRVDGQPGYFAQSLNVYGRQGEACLICATTLKGARHGQRSTAYCPRCQR
jgi:formamidopyrimidine-DNA glycosylase